MSSTGMPFQFPFLIICRSFAFLLVFNIFTRRVVQTPFLLASGFVLFLLVLVVFRYVGSFYTFACLWELSLYSAIADVRCS